jgi:hypothetical protein
MENKNDQQIVPCMAIRITRMFHTSTPLPFTAQSVTLYGTIGRQESLLC